MFVLNPTCRNNYGGLRLQARLFVSTTERTQAPASLHQEIAARALGARGCPLRGQQTGDSKRAGLVGPALRISHGKRAGASLASARK